MTQDKTVEVFPVPAYAIVDPETGKALEKPTKVPLTDYWLARIEECSVWLMKPTGADKEQELALKKAREYMAAHRRPSEPEPEGKGQVQTGGQGKGQGQGQGQ